MNTVVNAEGFSQKYAEEKGFAIDSSVELAELQACLEHPRVSICASSFADGRVFTLARQLRADGFAGVIRVCCDLLPDQFAMALRSGIDEVEISEAHANRCKEERSEEVLDGLDGVQHALRLVELAHLQVARRQPVEQQQLRVLEEDRRLQPRHRHDEADLAEEGRGADDPAAALAARGLVGPRRRLVLVNSVCGDENREEKFLATSTCTESG